MKTPINKHSQRWMFILLITEMLTGLWLGSVRAFAETGGNVWVVFADDTTPMNAIYAGNAPLVPLFQCMILGVVPRYSADTQQFTLSAKNWTLQGSLRSRRYRLNGKTGLFSQSPRLAVLNFYTFYTPTGKALPSPRLPFVPLLDIARLLRFSMQSDRGAEEHHAMVTLKAPAPQSYSSMLEPDMQSIMAPQKQSEGNLAVSAPSLDVDFNGRFLQVSVTNQGKTPYLADKRFLFLEMHNGTIISGDDLGGSTGGNPPELALPGQTITVHTDPLLYPVNVDGKPPIKAVYYVDGVHVFKWKVE